MALKIEGRNISYEGGIGPANILGLAAVNAGGEARLSGDPYKGDVRVDIKTPDREDSERIFGEELYKWLNYGYDPRAVVRRTNFYFEDGRKDR